MPNAYVLGTFKVDAPQKFKSEYAEKVDATLVPFGGKFIVRNPVASAKYNEGSAYTICVVLEFPSVDKAKAWYASDAYTAISKAKKAYSKTPTFIIVEGTGAAGGCFGGLAQCIGGGGSKGYVYGEFKPTSPKFKTEYASKVDATIAPFGGKFIVRKPVTEAALNEAAAFGIAVVLEFPSVENALAWKDSAEYKKIAPAKKAHSKTISFAIYGQ